MFAEKAEKVILRIGTLDSDPSIRPEGHIWISHKALWYEVNDDLLKYEEDIA